MLFLNFTVYRLDYSALIQTPEGKLKVIIEIEKAKLITDIMRFRHYLREQYSNKENYYEMDGKKKALPIISIYFLGYSISDIPGPVLDIRRVCTDRTTLEIYPIKDEFIESLTHDSYIIQINRLKEKRRNELEILLNVFDQDTISKDNHILNVHEEDFPKKHRPLIRRLQNAAQTDEVRQAMDIEDEILEELADLERKIEEKDKSIEEIGKTVVEKDKTIEEKDRIIADLMKKLQE